MAAAYIVILALAAWVGLHAIGSEKILSFATEVKPYASLFDGSSFGGPVEEDSAAKVIFFGDSNSYYPPDRAVAPQPESFSIHFPGLVLEEMEALGMMPEPRIMEWAFAGASMFEFYCLYYKAAKLSPDLIVIPINWRSFGSEWLENPTYIHLELSALAPLHSRLPLEYKDPIRAKGISTARQIRYRLELPYIYLTGFDIWVSQTRKSILGTDQEATIIPPKAPALDIETSQTGQSVFDTDQEETIIAPEAPPVDKGPRGEHAKYDELRISRKVRNLRSSYPMEISDKNPTFQRIRTLAYIASRHDTKVLFYIWPMDKELMKDLGVLNEILFEASRKAIFEEVNLHAGKNVFFADFSSLLRHKDFHDIHGHFTVEGRGELARTIAPQIVEILRGNTEQTAAHREKIPAD
jgi:hypothetical protein